MIYRSNYENLIQKFSLQSLIKFGKYLKIKMKSLIFFTGQIRLTDR